MTRKTNGERIANAMESVAKTNEIIAETQKMHNVTLQKLAENDAKQIEQHKSLFEKLKELASKHWYLVLIAMLAMIAMAGIKNFQVPIT